jgi:membrane associated rhomboid family serine protease
MSEIKSESQFLWKLILSILLLPITSILFLVGKRSVSDLIKPITIVFEFVKEAKVTWILIILNIVFFCVSLFFSEQIYLSFASYPQDLIEFRWHALITSGFLHGGIAHLLGNMLALFIFGRVVEKEVGAKKFLVVYFLALLISNIFSSLANLYILNNNIPGVGASGAIMGLVAGAILLKPFYFSYQFLVPLPIMVLGWMYIFTDITGILEGINDGVGRFAHLGGFISISIILFFLEKSDRSKLKKGFIINIISLLIFSGVYLFLL